MARGSGIRIVAIGGGTGLASMLRGLKYCTENLTAVVTVSDDGGGSGVLRQDLGMLPPGDIRNCILALANTEPIMYDLLNYRFSEGSLSGQSFGNLFLAALNGITGKFDAAVERMSDVLAITGRVLPISCDNIYLEATFENGAKIVGESKISDFKKEQKCRIEHVSLIPERASPHPEVLVRIQDADLIVLGPGSLYTSIIPNLLVDGIVEAIAATDALKVYVCNIMTQEGETEGYTAFEHIRELMKHSMPHFCDICLVNNAPISEEMLLKYAAERACSIKIDRELFADIGLELRERPLLDARAEKVRHDPLLLAHALMELYIEKRPRAGHFGDLDTALLAWLRQSIEDRENDL